MTTRRSAAVASAVVAVGAATLMGLTAGIASASGPGECIENVNVRAEPSLDAQIVALCEAGTAVQTGMVRNGFVEITDLGGWAAEEFISVDRTAPAPTPSTPGSTPSGPPTDDGTTDDSTADGGFGGDTGSDDSTTDDSTTGGSTTDDEQGTPSTTGATPDDSTGGVGPGTSDEADQLEPAEPAEPAEPTGGVGGGLL